MKTIDSLWRLPLRTLQYYRRQQFFRRFPNITRGSVIGADGVGKGCVLEGNEKIHIGANSSIGSGSELLVYQNHFDKQLDSKLVIGENARIAARCRITCAGNITIGNNVLFGPDVFITDHNHGMDPEAPGGYSPQEILVQDVKVGDGVWLGQRVCVLPGVTVGAHSIVGTNSVVTHDIPPYSMAVGSPARVIKQWNFEQKCWCSI